jgi:hypothetical protein
LVAKTSIVAGGRIEAARARARGAKLALGAVATVVLGVAFVGAKAHAAGHMKHRARPLAAPRSFERAVRRSVLAGGQIAPPVQPPPVATSTS